MKLSCRVPWRLAAYLKDVGPATADAEGMLTVMKAQKKFFEGILQNGNKSSDPNAWWFHKVHAVSQASGSAHALHRLCIIFPELCIILRALSLRSYSLTEQEKLVSCFKSAEPL